MLALAFGLVFEDLYRQAGLDRLDAAFRSWLAGRDAKLHQTLLAARLAPPEAGSREESALLIDLGPPLESFVAELFGIQQPLAALQAQHTELAPLIRTKWKFVKRKALLGWPDLASLGDFDADAALAQIEGWLGERFEENTFARAVLRWQQEGLSERLELCARYCAWAIHSPLGRQRHPDSILFRHPSQVDAADLLPELATDLRQGASVRIVDTSRLRRREGFSLTDAGPSLADAVDQANYCLWCHQQGKDSCSKGLRNTATAGPSGFRRNSLGDTLAGCPLEERISEFLLLKSRGHPIAALAMITLDNPMVAATGHRICNDCMKSCVYQHQTPVDIPAAETRSLRDVLMLPWGFEIYSLLTRWNPLNLRQPLPMPDSGRKVLVVGMGPAGFTLAHHLLNDGHGVIAIDGLKIEPLPSSLAGVDDRGEPCAFEPIEDIGLVQEDLADRVMAGFGGVAEYGITARWDKNFLKLIRLLLERRERFRLVGGVRFGGNLEAADAFADGFDHIALALGAGRPTLLEIPGALARGVRLSSDFLMALQLTGAARSEALANMQIRLPVVVIGGGLTAIDTATEALAYYPLQVEKFLSRHEALAELEGEAKARARWPEQEITTAETFLAHARAIRAERARARHAGEPPRIVELLQSWGGVTIAYRKRLQESPAYTRNHEEVGKALEEGIAFAEGLTPIRIETDANGTVEAAVFSRSSGAQQDQPGASPLLRLPAGAVFVAAGTAPNTVLAREDPSHFALNGRYFQAVDEDGVATSVDASSTKPSQTQVLMRGHPDGRMMSFFGDLHPAWAGNVVRAMASARRGHRVISRQLAKLPPASAQGFTPFATQLSNRLRARVLRVERLAPGILEVVIHAPMAARKFRPGQFFRLQNFESLAQPALIAGRPTAMVMEALALTGAWVDVPRGLVATVVLEMGASSMLCESLRPGEPVILMGPTGAPTDIVAGQTVVLAGGGLGNAVLFSIGAALREAGSRVVYFAGYRRLADRFHVAQIEAAADVVVWCCDEAPGYMPNRPQDRSFVGNLVDAMIAYGKGELGEPDIALQRADRILAIGSDRMMAAVARARRGALAPFLKPDHVGLASINSPMQCMMKEVCAQCLQPQHDPVTGRVTYVFSCFEQDQPMDRVDFDALDQRLKQNALAEAQAKAWLGHRIVQRNIPG